MCMVYTVTLSFGGDCVRKSLIQLQSFLKLSFLVCLQIYLVFAIINKVGNIL